MRARTSCRRCSTRATWRSARSDSTSRSRGGDVWPTPSGLERRTRPAASDGHATIGPFRAVFCPRRADLADGRRRRRHARDHARSSDAPIRRRARRRPTAPAQPPSADRVRDYQDRLRLLEAQAMRDAQADCAGAGRRSRSSTTTRSRRRRRTRSRRSEAARIREPVRQQRRAQPRLRPSGRTSAATRRQAECVAAIGRSESVGRRSRRRGCSGDHENRGTARSGSTVPAQAPAPCAATSDQHRATGRGRRPTKRRRSAPPDRCIVLEGTVIDTVLTNRLDGRAPRR